MRDSGVFGVDLQVTANSSAMCCLATRSAIVHPKPTNRNQPANLCQSSRIRDRLFVSDNIPTVVHERRWSSGLAADDARRLSLKAYRMVYLIGSAALAASDGDAESASALVAESDRIGAEIGYELELPDRLFRERFIDARIGIDAGGDNS